MVRGSLQSRFRHWPSNTNRGSGVQNGRTAQGWPLIGGLRHPRHRWSKPPCVSVRWITGAGKVLAGQGPVAGHGSDGHCIEIDQSPSAGAIDRRRSLRSPNIFLSHHGPQAHPGRRPDPAGRQLGCVPYWPCCRGPAAALHQAGLRLRPHTVIHAGRGASLPLLIHSRAVSIHVPARCRHRWILMGISPALPGLSITAAVA